MRDRINAEVAVREGLPIVFPLKNAALTVAEQSDSSRHTKGSAFARAYTKGSALKESILDKE